MGFEYRIIVKFTRKQLSEIEELLSTQKTFDKKCQLGNSEFMEFKKPDNLGKMPNVSLSFERDGIYVCQHGTDNLWESLDALKAFLKKEELTYKIYDYQVE